MTPKQLNELRAALVNIERDEGIRILHVAECDSRAWGFATEDSDFDLRFCFYKLPWYHTIQKQDETMRRKVRLDGTPCDMQGFSLGHMMSKIGQSSFAMYEMLLSPIQLAYNQNWRQLFVAAAQQYLVPVDVMNHCRGLARKNYEFVKPFDAKHMLHSLRFSLLAETIKHGDTIELNLPALLANSGFADRAQEILQARHDRFWTPDEQVCEYLHRICHRTDWPAGKEFVEHNERWARDLNMILQFVTEQVCKNYDGIAADDLTWIDDVADTRKPLIESGEMNKAVQHGIPS